MGSPGEKVLDGYGSYIPYPLADPDLTYVAKTD